MKILKMNTKTKIGGSVFGVLIIIAIFEPVINNFRLNGKSPLSLGINPAFLPPSLELPLGTDPYGRDLFGLLLIGIAETLSIGLLAGAIEIVIAVMIGLFAGYKGGLADHVLRSITDALLIIPTWPLLIFLTLYLRQMDIIGISLLIAVFGWPRATRSIRSQVLTIKERPYIELAKMSGFKDWEIIFKEIVPNIFPYICVGFTNVTLGAMQAETAFRMLIGVGPINLPTLGYLASLALRSGFLITRLYALLPPILVLVVILVSLSLVNIGLDEVYNPRLKKITGL
jgi:peptide/nickel transport system permease protein